MQVLFLLKCIFIRHTIIYFCFTVDIFIICIIILHIKNITKEVKDEHIWQEKRFSGHKTAKRNT